MVSVHQISIFKRSELALLESMYYKHLGVCPFHYVLFICVQTHTLGAQLREWLLYFSLPVLKGVLPAGQLNHFSYLVAGIHIVLSDSISDADLSCADRCFHQFYSQFTGIYGNQYV